MNRTPVPKFAKNIQSDGIIVHLYDIVVSRCSQTML